jgi:hypothetical protein
MRVLMLSLLLLNLAACAATSPRSQGDCDLGAYRVAVEEIIRTDQQYRTAISWGTTDEAELARLKALPDDEQMAAIMQRQRDGVSLSEEVEKELWDKQIAIDRANTKLLMRWVRACGWPSEELLGEGTPSMVPVLIHMQMEDAEWVLPVLREEVLAGRMPPRPYAMIFDRKQHHEGKPQIYGMTQAYDSKTRTVLPPAIVDLDATNAARAEIGMDPIEEYRITDEATAAGR